MSGRRVESARHQREVVEDEHGVDAGHRPHSPARQSEVLVDQQEDQPDADHDALLDQEEITALLDQPIHEGIGFGAAALEPDQREERVENVEDEDADE